MKVNYIELLGEKHPVCFSLAASEAVNEAFGSLEGMAEQMYQGNSALAIAALDKIIPILLDAGRRYCALAGVDTPEPLKCRPAEVIGVSELPTLTDTIFNLIKDDSARTVEAVGKNGEATQGG